jgi:hypothetical protein
VGISFYVVDGTIVAGWLPGVFARFCALFSAHFGSLVEAAHDCLQAGMVLRVFCAMKIALWKTSFMVRFWRRIPGSVGPIIFWA